jgi:hypothetical protein
VWKYTFGQKIRKNVESLEDIPKNGKMKEILGQEVMDFGSGQALLTGFCEQGKESSFS